MEEVSNKSAVRGSSLSPRRGSVDEGLSSSRPPRGMDPPSDMAQEEEEDQRKQQGSSSRYTSRTTKVEEEDDDSRPRASPPRRQRSLTPPDMIHRDVEEDDEPPRGAADDLSPHRSARRRTPSPINRGRSMSPEERQTGEGRRRSFSPASSRGRRSSSPRRRSPDARGANDDDEAKATSLIVRHLKYTTSPQVVRDHFQQCGSVKDVYLPLEYHTGRPRGFGFVEFVHSRDAWDALQTLNDSELDGSRISISIAQHGRKTPDAMRARSGPQRRRRDHIGGGGSSSRREPYSAPPDRERNYSPPRSRDRHERRYDDRGGSSRYDRGTPPPRGGYDRSPPPRRYSRDESRYDDRRR